MAGHGRIVVWASRRGTHLGHRSCASAAEGRTYERKQSNDANRLRQPCETGAVHIWHLLVNASEALRGIVERHQSEFRDVAHRLVHASSDGRDAMRSAPTSEVHNPQCDPLRDSLALPWRRDANQRDRPPYWCIRQRRASMGSGRPVHALPPSPSSEPTRPSSPFRRDPLTGGRTQRDRSPSRTARPGLHGRLRHRPTLGCAAAVGGAGQTGVRSDPVDASHHPMADRRSGDAVAGGSCLHRSILRRCPEAQASRRGCADLRRTPAPRRSGRTDALA